MAHSCNGMAHVDSILINLKAMRERNVERILERVKPPPQPSVVKKPTPHSEWKMEIIQHHEHDMISLRRKLDALNSALDRYEDVEGSATFLYYIGNLRDYVSSTERQLAKAKAAQASFLRIQGVTEAERDQLHWDMSTMGCSIQYAIYDCESATRTIDRVLSHASVGVVLEPPKLAPINPKDLKVEPEKKKS